MQIVVFTIGEKYYAIETEKVDEIAQRLAWSSIPTAPEWVQGLVNLRGEVVTLINFQQLLYPDGGSEKLCYNRSIILSTEKNKIALMVDEVEEVSQIEPEDIQLSENGIDNKVAGLIAVKDKVVSLLNLGALLPKSEGE